MAAEPRLTEPGGGILLVSGPGQACLDALRCAAFLGQQHPQDLKQAILDTTTASSSSRTTTAEGGEEAGGLRWLEALVSLLQGMVGEAGARGGSRRRRRKKRRRREQGFENEQGRTGEEQERWEEEEEDATVRRRRRAVGLAVGCGSRAGGLMRRAWRAGWVLCGEQASEEEEEEGGSEASGGAWAGEGPAGGHRAPGQQLQQQQGGAAGGTRQRPEERGGMEVDPAASVSASARPRADLVISSGSRRRAGAATRRAAVADALGSGDVVGNIFSFVVGVGGASTGRQSVRQLGQLGLVCRKWREVSMWESWWADAAEEMLPVSVWGRGEGGGRGRVLEHGRVVWCERRVWFGEEGWSRGLSVQFEVFDRMDGLQMLSARGPLLSKIVLGGRRMWLGIGRGRRWEVVGRPFSAASRDPEQRRFQSMRDFFWRGHEAGFASSVCVRVIVMDERTGRRAVLWEEEGKLAERGVYDVPNVYQPWVGEGGFALGLVRPQTVMCPLYSGLQLYGRAEFHVSPVAGQGEGVSEQERLYQLVGGDEQHYEEHPSVTALIVSQGDTGDPNAPPVIAVAVSQFVRSVLGMGQV